VHLRTALVRAPDGGKRIRPLELVGRAMHLPAGSRAAEERVERFEQAAGQPLVRAGPATFGGLFWNRRAYSWVATEPRLKNALCTGPTSVSVVISTSTEMRCCKLAGSP
jgi:hypothetical protein